MALRAAVLQMLEIQINITAEKVDKIKTEVKSKKAVVEDKVKCLDEEIIPYKKHEIQLCPKCGKRVYITTRY